MLITFTSKHSPDVVMFGDVATALLRAMGVSDRPPGILRGEDIRAATERLRQYLRTLPEEPEAPEAADQENDEQDEEAEPAVGPQQRALPLLQMLDTAYREGEDVIWR